MTKEENKPTYEELKKALLENCMTDWAGDGIGGCIHCGEDDHAPDCIIRRLCGETNDLH